MFYCNNPKYWDTLSTYHTCPKMANNVYSDQIPISVCKGLSVPILRVITVVSLSDITLGNIEKAGCNDACPAL